MKVPPEHTALVVDDDEELRHLVCRALEKQDIFAQQAFDGLAASEMIAKRQYDALVTDLRMPRKHGFKLINEVLEMHPRPIIFVVTGIIEPKLAHDLCVRGVESLDLKPLHYAEFAAKVRGMLEYRSERGARSAQLDVSLDGTAEQLNARLESVADSFEQAIQRLRKQKNDLEQGYVGSVRMLSGLFGASEKSEGVHGHRVEAMAASIGERMGIKGRNLRDLRLAALLHEIGQFSMPDRLKQSPPWSLPPEDREQFEKYPSIGATLLSEIPGTEGVVPLVESHCENYNGSGFPKKTRGSDIPLGGRIIRIADGYDTFVMYADSEEPEEEAKRHLADKRGKVHDPELFAHAINYIDEILAKKTVSTTKSIPLRELEDGVTLAENIYDDEGRFLAAQGAVVTHQLATRLAEMLGSRSVLVYLDSADQGAD